jgi:ATP-dependent exoDNAse (exonuclease V) alpha subunit
MDTAMTDSPQKPTSLNPTSSQRISSRLDELIKQARSNMPKAPVIENPMIETGLQRQDIVKQKSEEFQREVDELRKKKEEELRLAVKELEKNAPKFEWNDEQQSFIDAVIAGQSVNLIGKAGTGKTTVTREAIKELISTGKVGPMRESTKFLQAGLPGICVVSFTNRAVKNIAKGMSGDMKDHTITLHKLLEFEPEFFEVQQADGSYKNVRKFVPKRNNFNPLPKSLKVIIFEESSMISVELFRLLEDALHHEVQFIFLGDLQQLPPVYGSAILGFKLLELPTVELTKIYRQAEGSPIISFAWRVSNGEEITKEEFEKINKESHGKVHIRAWKKKLDDFDALHMMNLLFNQFVDQGHYNPEEDMIMIPFNKKFGTIEFNKNLAQHLGKKRGATVYEIIAGFNKYYYAVGDKILADRQEGIIEEIRMNGDYVGNLPMPASPQLNRWGLYEKEAGEKSHESAEQDLEEVEKFLTLQMQSREGET